MNQELQAKLKEIEDRMDRTKSQYRAEMKRLRKARKGIAMALEQLDLALGGAK